jgi:hypothetical protein
VSGIETRSGHLVDGFRLVYDPIRVQGTPVAQGKTMYGEWRGGDGGGPGAASLKACSAIGVSGRCGVLLDSLSLVGVLETKEVAAPFNGKDFDGWQFKDPQRRHWVVGQASLDPQNPARFRTEKARDASSAQLINAQGGNIMGDIYTTAKFGDCTIELEFMLAKGADSGVYVMGEYEVQIFDSYGKPRIELVDLGAVFGVPSTGAPGLAPRTNAAKAPGVWQKLLIEFARRPQAR